MLGLVRIKNFPKVTIARFCLLTIVCLLRVLFLGIHCYSAGILHLRHNLRLSCWTDGCYRVPDYRIPWDGSCRAGYCSQSDRLIYRTPWRDNRTPWVAGRRVYRGPWSGIYRNPWIDRRIYRTPCVRDGKRSGETSGACAMKSDECDWTSLKRLLSCSLQEKKVQVNVLGN